MSNLDDYYKKYGQPKPKTNGDIIRAMTDEELAKVLHNAGANWYSEEYYLKWLNQDYITFVAQEYEKDLNDRLNREGISP